ncbi:unnamed protein product [Pleuronectes platessa]|uniref:Uncharacterized protein n=1 Tax=Pleuronectes platessa TaxID=8262 RepID=A0A9N7ZBN5_PLEPL|nr:unnamed protein product [Pleuronectes platessa]
MERFSEGLVKNLSICQSQLLRRRTRRRKKRRSGEKQEFPEDPARLPSDVQEIEVCRGLPRMKVVTGSSHTVGFVTPKASFQKTPRWALAPSGLPGPGNRIIIGGSRPAPALISGPGHMSGDERGSHLFIGRDVLHVAGGMNNALCSGLHELNAPEEI